MFTNASENTRRVISAMAAIFVVVSAGTALEQGHGGTLRQGTVEVGELTPIHLDQLAMATLPEIEVVGARSLLAAAAAQADQRAPG